MTISRTDRVGIFQRTEMKECHLATTACWDPEQSKEVGRKYTETFKAHSRLIMVSL